jgi:hypothetical protein
LPNIHQDIHAADLAEKDLAAELREHLESTLAAAERTPQPHGPAWT